MKLKILTLIAILFSINGYAQRKGTNAISLGISIDNEQQEDVFVNTQESKSKSYSLGFGFFFNDHDKIGVELLHSNSKNEFRSLRQPGGSEADRDSYGGNLSYQHYYLLSKALYLYAGVNGGFTHSKYVYTDYYELPIIRSDVQKNYSSGAFGGVAWFVSKTFAFEVNIISLNFNYNISSEIEESSNDYVSKTGNSTNFNLTTQGLINNLGIKIFILF